MTVFWDLAPCSLVEIDRRFRDAYCRHRPGFLGLDAVSCRWLPTIQRNLPPQYPVQWRALVNTVMKLWVPWRWGISWPPERLAAPQEEFRSKKLVTYVGLLKMVTTSCRYHKARLSTRLRQKRKTCICWNISKFPQTNQILWSASLAD
jgi:hypothetical protein